MVEERSKLNKEKNDALCDNDNESRLKKGVNLIADLTRWLVKHCTTHYRCQSMHHFWQVICLKNSSYISFISGDK